MTWALRPLNDVLDLIEFGELSAEEALNRWRAAPKRPVHPALAQWTEHAVRGYLAAVAEIPLLPGVPDGASLEPVSRVWARQRGPLRPGDPDVYEEMVTDRRYAGHGVRELRLVRKESVRGRPADTAEIAIAAGVLAGGSPVLSSRWDKNPFRLGTFTPSRLVRLVEIGCVDASCNVLFEGTPAEAYALYDSTVEARVRQVIAGSSYRPGEYCGRCRLVATCPAVPSRPGLLGIDEYAELPRRSWSVSTGRAYRQCPARAHLEDLSLPRGRESSEAAARGRAVHAWIESRHLRTSPQRCDPRDVPGPADGWVYGGQTLTGLQARLGLQMVGDHALVCPVPDSPVDAEFHPERSVVVYDPDADVVVIAKTDLLYRVEGRWTVRETKTARAVDQGDPLEQYPQLALATLLSHEGALPAADCRVELERLTGSGPVVTELDASAPDVISQAQRVVRELVSAWHTDLTYQTRPGKACEDCPFTRWCPDAARKTEA